MARCNCDRCGREYTKYYCGVCDKEYFDWLRDMSIHGKGDIPLEQRYKYAAMAIVNYCLEQGAPELDVKVRQAMNDKCDQFAIQKLKELFP